MDSTITDRVEWSHSFSILDSSLDLLLSHNRDEERLSELRLTRYVHSRTLVLLVAIMTQIVVLAVIAVIMGVAVLTMCAVLGELLVIVAIATVLERQIFSFADIATFMEVSATVLVTIITVFLAAVSSGAKMTDGNVAAYRFV